MTHSLFQTENTPGNELTDNAYEEQRKQKAKRAFILNALWVTATGIAVLVPAYQIDIAPQKAFVDFVETHQEMTSPFIAYMPPHNPKIQITATQSPVTGCTDYIGRAIKGEASNGQFIVSPVSRKISLCHPSSAPTNG